MTTRSEELFDQPDIPADLDRYELDITQHWQALLTRTRKRWTATLQDPPEGHVIHVQGATWRETADAFTEALRGLPGYDSDVAGISFVPADPEAADVLDKVRAARRARLMAEQAERDAVRDAIYTLMDREWTNRDIGSLLGLSHQRISQIAPRS
ncbi:hypothetical protein AB0I81_41180 [Nonomuraea sp. NPDC050404]|uniref:hypothetical protein n=1 Tax=Nonomuraea sp. NPDC050404 TaxID=3155783 RepID=UPI0033E2F5C0